MLQLSGKLDEPALNLCYWVIMLTRLSDTNYVLNEQENEGQFSP